MYTVHSADGTAIAFDRSGEGPPVVIVVGAFCDRSSPASLAAALARDFSVHCYDRRGRGNSGPGGEPSIEREVEDLAAVIDAAGGSAFVVGHSSGAALALEGAARGLPIMRLAAYEPPYTVDAADADLTFAPRIQAVLDAGRPGDAVVLFLGGDPDVASEEVAQMQAGPGWPHLLAMAPSLPFDLAVVGEGGIPERLAKIAVPTLVLAGGASWDWIQDTAEATAARITGAEHRVLAGQTHGPADDVFAAELRRFFLGTMEG